MHQPHPENLAGGPQSFLVSVENYRQSGRDDRRFEELIEHELRILIVARTVLIFEAHIERPGTVVHKV